MGKTDKFSIERLLQDQTGSFLALITGDKKVKIVNSKDGSLITGFEPNINVLRNVVWSTSGSLLALTLEDGRTTQIFNIAKGIDPIASFKTDAAVTSISWNASDKWLAVADENKRVNIFDIDARALSKQLDYGEIIWFTTWSPTANRIAIVDASGRFSWRNLEEEIQPEEIAKEIPWPFASYARVTSENASGLAAWSKRGNLAFRIEPDVLAYVDFFHGKRESMVVKDGIIRAISFSPDGSYLGSVFERHSGMSSSSQSGILGWQLENTEPLELKNRELADSLKHLTLHQALLLNACLDACDGAQSFDWDRYRDEFGQDINKLPENIKNLVGLGSVSSQKSLT